MKMAWTAMAAAMVALMPMAVRAADVDFCFKINYTDWKECVPGNSRDLLAEESGPIFSAGANAVFRPVKNLFEQLEVKGFSGLAYYQGTYVLSSLPIEAFVGRIGLTVESTTGYEIKIGKDFCFSPFVALGYSPWWMTEGEMWFFGYGRLGTLIEAGKFFVKAGALIPLFTQDSLFLQDLPWLNDGRLTSVMIYPKGVPTPFVEAGIRLAEMDISVFYELRQWGQSDCVNDGGYYISQPAIAESSIGVGISLPF